MRAIRWPEPGRGTVLAFNIHVYDALKLVHVLAAVCWVGGVVMIQVFVTKTKHEGDMVKLAVLAKDIAWVGERIISAFSGVVIVFAVILVIYGPYNFSDTWILLAIAGFLITFVTGITFLGPESGRLSTLSTERGAEDPEVQRRLARIFLVSRLDMVLLLLIVADMVLKPGA
jgi:uncharacterized membrane protein